MHTVKFNQSENPTTFNAFLNAINWIKAEHDVHEPTMIVRSIEQQFKIILTWEKSDSTRYTAKFPSKKDFTWFMLRWS